MKDILVPTDFSAAAENAAHYAIALAKVIKANVTLVNAYKVPAEAPMAAQVAWPLIEENDLEAEANGSLAEFIDKVCKSTCEDTDQYCPALNFESAKGELVEVVREVVDRKKSDLVIMGTVGAGQLMQWALGSQSKKMIDEANFPVLYVPFAVRYKKIKRIAFTTDLSEDDLLPLQFLCRLAKVLDAEIHVYHITSFEANRVEEEKGMEKAYFSNVVSQIDYPAIKFENIWHSDVHQGLNWIRNSEGVDLMAMVHRQHTLLDKLLNGSYAHKLSRFTQVPLLIFQPYEKKV